MPFELHAHAEEEEEEGEEGEEEEGDEDEDEKEEGSQAGLESQPLDTELGESFFCKKMFVSGLRSAPGVPTEVSTLLLKACSAAAYRKQK